MDTDKDGFLGLSEITEAIRLKLKIDESIISDSQIKKA